MLERRYAAREEQRRCDHEIGLMGGHLSSYMRMEGGGTAEEAEEDPVRARARARPVDGDDNLHAISHPSYTPPTYDGWSTT